jgi:hypothetical protein
MISIFKRRVSKKELAKRIRSLENYLGLAYVEESYNHDYYEHIPTRYGQLVDIEKDIKKLQANKSDKRRSK